MRTPSLYSQDDPLSAALAVDPNETEAERHIRLQREAEARRISERIDEDLRQERERLKRAKGDVKLLLLGQAESGKSTLQKQFQIMYKPKSLDMERASWRAVIYFNIVHSVKHILTTLAARNDQLEDNDAITGDDSSSSRRRYANGSTSPHQSSPPQSLHSANDAHGGIPISHLRKRLNALVNTDDVLADRLSGGVTVAGSGKGGVYVRSGWQAKTIENAINRARGKHGDNSKIVLDPHVETDPMVQTVGKMLGDVHEEIQMLWSHPIVRGLIKRRKLKLDEWAEFFFRNIIRIVETGYIPTIDDILHARIQTMGVAEHVFDVNIHGKAVAWHLFDVGGARGQRHSWVPFFDDANAIIFVAPVSAFDQYLEEDPRTNRIDDSLQLFTQICSNTLLKNVHLVLFLNKTDLLRMKLERGLIVRKYITSFGDRSNDYETVVQYFRAHFLQVHRRNNENRRVLYTHFTNVTDTKATQRIIGNVRDSIFRGYLQSAALV
ncbi:guanine nucleotide binding protein, alpha subunit [Flagelloscypha sp. PMI_526]|nr:guanine nucleotide binding protein, alpha subunit [Flagelloscypha sp. PMI_526]